MPATVDTSKFEARPHDDAPPVSWPPIDLAAPGIRGLLGKSMGRFYPARGPMDPRNKALYTWVQERARQGLWPYALCSLAAPTTETRVRHSAGTLVEGINLTAVDYLGLSQDERVKEAAIRAIRDYGVHMPSSGPLMGNTPASRRLEKRIATMLGRENTFLCPTGWAAGFAAISGLVRKDDIIVMDELAHQCLQQASYASTPNVKTFRHLDNADLDVQLKTIRDSNPRDAILVITEGLFSMDGDSPDLRGLTAICRQYGALVLVDVAHDLGATGPGGTGTIGANGQLQEIDIIVGSFSKSFGTDGGFISSKSSPIEWAQLCFGGPYTYSTAISPVQVAVADEAVQVISSAEGELLRQRLRDTIAHTRTKATSLGLTLMGAPSPIVPVLIGTEAESRLAGMLSFQKGLIATCLEFPIVQRGASRYRISLSPRFVPAQIDKALTIIAASIQEARAALNASHQG
jgi:7-keto-8-aminopelargonate synthetase-like enzyme